MTNDSSDREIKQNAPLIVQRTFNAPVGIVWKALTDNDQLKKWYFQLPEFRAEVGFRFEFTGGPSPEKQYRHLCEVTEVEPEKRLTYSWRYDGFSGNSFVSFELAASVEGTVLTLTHTGLESFPKENSDFAAKNFVEGWNHIVNISLKDFIDSVTV